MNEIKEIKKAWAAVKSTVDTTFDRLILTLDGEEVTDLPTEYVLPLNVDTNLFIGKKPVAVLFGEERIDVKTWREVYGVILSRCIQNEQLQQNLMNLRGRLAGKIRTFIADKPDGMTRPIKIADGLYGETHYGSATLMHVLCERILKPVNFDFSNISLVLKEGKRKYG